jgi:hypothetical protein
MNTRPTALTLLAQVANLLSAAAAVTAMVKMGGGVGALASLFTVWVLLPFVLTFAALAMKPSSAVVLCVFFLGSVLSLFAYYDLAFPSSRIRSTAALAFIFLPLWQTIWTLGVAACSLIVDFRQAHAPCQNCGERFETEAIRCPSCGIDRSEFDPKPVILAPPALDSNGGYRCTACNAKVNYGRSQCDACGQQFSYHP